MTHFPGSQGGQNVQNSKARLNFPLQMLVQKQKPESQTAALHVPGLTWQLM